MYRLLEVGEVIEKGDEFWCSSPRQWEKASSSIGAKMSQSHGPVRRKINDVKPAATGPDPGEGWRLLEVGELVQKGDEYYSAFSEEWVESDNWRTSVTVKPATAAILGYRRRVSSTPDPGEGYRLIDKAVDKPQPGDEYWCGSRGTWETRACGRYDTTPFGRRDTYRRRIEPARREVKAGDRVRVLSGPWAGCTGVVLHVQESKAVKSLPQYDVQLDNVFVAGYPLRLFFQFTDIQPLPVEPCAVVWRELEIGEVIRKGDEIYVGKWETVAPALNGAKLCAGDRSQIRRLCRIQSPGWRYLDAGETIRKGDEWVQNGHSWGVATAVGDKAEPITETGNVKIRRKLPDCQGG